MAHKSEAAREVAGMNRLNERARDRQRKQERRAKRTVMITGSVPVEQIALSLHLEVAFA